MQADVLLARQVGVEARLLEDDADLSSDGRRVEIEVVAGDGDGATRLGEGRRQDRDGGRLAGAVRAEEGEQLAGCHVEADVIDGRDLRVLVALDQVVRRRSSRPRVGSSVGGLGRSGNTVPVSATLYASAIIGVKCQADRSSRTAMCAARWPTRCVGRSGLQRQKRDQMRDDLRDRLEEMRVRLRHPDGPGIVVWTRLESATPRARREVDRIVAVAIELADTAGSRTCRCAALPAASAPARHRSTGTSATRRNC